MVGCYCCNMEAHQTEANAVQELITQDGVDVSRGTHNDWVVQVTPELTTAGPALDPVEVWADHHADTHKVHELPTQTEGAAGYTIDRKGA
jgi:hypothetical protein